MEFVRTSRRHQQEHQQLALSSSLDRYLKQAFSSSSSSPLDVSYSRSRRILRKSLRLSDLHLPPHLLRSLFEGEKIGGRSEEATPLSSFSTALQGDGKRKEREEESSHGEISSGVIGRSIHCHHLEPFRVDIHLRKNLNLLQALENRCFSINLQVARPSYHRQHPHNHSSSSSSTASCVSGEKTNNTELPSSRMDDVLLLCIKALLQDSSFLASKDRALFARLFRNKDLVMLSPSRFPLSSSLSCQRGMTGGAPRLLHSSLSSSLHDGVKKEEARIEERGGRTRRKQSSDEALGEEIEVGSDGENKKRKHEKKIGENKLEEGEKEKKVKKEKNESDTDSSALGRLPADKEEVEKEDERETQFFRKDKKRRTGTGEGEEEEEEEIYEAEGRGLPKKRNDDDVNDHKEGREKKREKTDGDDEMKKKEGEEGKEKDEEDDEEVEEEDISYLLPLETCLLWRCPLCGVSAKPHEIVIDRLLHEKFRENLDSFRRAHQHRLKTESSDDRDHRKQNKTHDRTAMVASSSSSSGNLFSIKDLRHLLPSSPLVSTPQTDWHVTVRKTHQ